MVRRPADPRQPPGAKTTPRGPDSRNVPSGRGDDAPRGEGDPTARLRRARAEDADRAKARRPDGLGLWTFQVNAPAIRFYLRHGFRIIRRTDGAGNEEREPDLRMEWRPPL
jgi:hypothetical protein